MIIVLPSHLIVVMLDGSPVDAEVYDTAIAK